MIIIDGSGKGYKAKVDQNNKLETNSVMETEEAYISSNYARAYTISTHIKKLNSTNDHAFLYIKNDSQIYDLRLWAVHYSWNGGDTNHNRVVKWSWLGNPGVPTANYETITPINLNSKSNRSPDITAYKWNGVGDGMTMTSNGIIVSEALFAQGHETIDVMGVPVIGFNNTAGVLFTGEEVGDVGITIRFFMKDAIGV